MHTVEELIGNLLLRYNCVIVPSFGGFVAKQSSATIDYKNGVMMPPGKSVMFNRQLVSNDGLLIAEYAALNKLIYPEAEASILGNVAEWNEKLRNGERVTLDRVGYLFYDQEKNICFEQDRFFNLLLESYGLGKVHFVTEEDIKISEHLSHVTAQQLEENEEPTFKLVSMPTIEEEKVVVSEDEFVLVEHPSKSSTSIWKYVAAAVLLPIGFYSFWLPMKTNVLESGLLSINDFNPSYKATEGKYEKHSLFKVKEVKLSQPTLENVVKKLPSDVTVYSYELDDDTYIPVRLSDKKIVSEKEVTKESATSLEENKKLDQVKIPVKNISQPISKLDTKISSQPTDKKTEKIITPKVVSISKNKNFDFIVGSFATADNATLLVDKLKNAGLKAYLITDTSGKFRVSAGSAVSVEEIKVIAEKAKVNGVEGWILKK